MHRSLLVSSLMLLVAGCGTSAIKSETTREVVLQYLGTDVGTAGPFFKGGKNELGGLSDSDRRQAETLIDQGAAVFLVYSGHRTGDTAGTGADRIVLVSKGQVVGDFRTVAKAPVAAPTGT
jgi:hypothetical protein